MTPPWPSLTELRAAAEEYKKCWWESDPHVLQAIGHDSALDAHLASLSAVRSIDVFRRDGRIYTPARQSVHATIVGRQLGSGPKPTHPTAYFTIGCMGAGKTSVLRRFVDERRRLDAGDDTSSLSQVAADEVRAALPGYGEGERRGLGSVVVHHECFDVTYRDVYPAVAAAGYDLVYDTIGKMIDGVASFEGQLLSLKDAGYRIELLRADAPLDVCIKRAEARALATGRLVEANDQRDVFDGPPAVECRLRDEGLLDGLLVVDTSSDDGGAPIIEASAEWRDRHADLETLVFG